MTVAEGASLGRYTIVAPLGSGAMGEVYRARDDVLRREVAIKILPEARWDDPRRRARFEREARALARISHPNILAIHDFGTEDGVSYAVTELLEGENLRQRIHAGALSWDEAAQITARVADGLAAAHEHGIVHRDLKPENIFLTSDGAVKILDFGIARIVETDAPPEGSDPRAPATALTRPDMVMGTVGYMSPEQVAGNTVDGRSDIFSLGCVLYEAVSGEQPFRRETDAETMFSILREEPPDLASTGTNAPAGAQRILDRCLGKEPASRYSTADELAVELRSLPTGQAAVGLGLFSRPRLRMPRRRSLLWGAVVAAVAVVATLGALQVPKWLAGAARSDVQTRTVRVDAFENRTGDPTLDPLGSAAADAVSDALLRSGMVGVAQTNASDPAVREAGLEGLPLLGILGSGDAAATAGTVVDGEYFLRDDAVEIHARVRDRVRGELAHVIEPVRGVRDDPDGLTREVSERIRDGVLWHLHPRAEFGASGEPPSFEAYREYTIGMELYDRLSDKEKPLPHLERAAELDASFLEPRVWLLQAYWSMCIHRSGRSACAKAEELLGELQAAPERFSPLGRILVRALEARLHGHSVTAYSVLRDALHLAPDDPGVHWLVADAAFRANRYADAIGILERIENEEPPWFNKPRFHLLADCRHMTGDYLGELEMARQAASRYPDDGFVRRRLGRALAALGRIDEVDDLIDESFAVDNPFNLMDLLFVVGTELHVHGWREPAARVGERWLAWIDEQAKSNPDSNPDHPLGRTCRARALELAGRHDEARAIWEGLVAEKPEMDYLCRLFGLGSYTFLTRVAMAAARDGDRERATEVAQLLVANPGSYSFGVPEFLRSEVAALLDDRDEAIALLRQALAAGYPQPDNIHFNPAFESIRDDPEFRDLLYPKD